jgi:PAS domain S-box-containing protein
MECQEGVDLRETEIQRQMEEDKTKQQLIEELDLLRRRIAELEASEPERKREEEEALRNSEARYRALVEQVPAATYAAALDALSSTLYFSPQVEKMLGFSQAEWLADPDLFCKQLHPDDRERVLSELSSSHASGEPFKSEYRLLARDGSVVWFRDEASVVRDGAGNPLFLQGVMLDITERKQAEEKLERRVKQLTALNRASQAVNASLELEQVLDEIVSLAGEVTESDYTTVVMVDEKGELIPGAEILPGTPDVVSRTRAEGHTAWVTRSRQAVIVNDVAEDGTIISQEPAGAPRTLNPHLAKIGVKSLAGLPLIARGRLLGALFLASLRPHHFHDQLPLLSTFANQAAIAIENARLYEEAARRAQYLATLNEVNRALTSALDLDRVFSLLLSLGREMLDAEACSVALVDESTGELAFKQAAGEVGEPVVGLRLRPGEGIVGWVVEHGKAIWVADAQSDPRFYGDVKGDDEDFSTHDLMCAPLIAQGRVIGAVEVLNKRDGVFCAEDLDLLESIAAQAAVAVENAQLLKAVTRHRRDLQSLSTRLINAQEAERKRISQELHDEMGQALTAISINLAAIEKELPPELVSMTRDRLAETSSLTDQTLEQMRELSLDLRPSMLDDLGLVPTLRWYVNRYAKRTNIAVEFEAIDFEERLAAEMETALYRAVQEALTNVARHARADRVRLHLEREESKVSVFIEDDGQGFDAQEVADRKTPERGMGLLGIRERVASLGGRLSIRSRPGQGTRLSIEMPWRGES